MTIRYTQGIGAIAALLAASYSTPLLDKEIAPERKAKREPESEEPEEQKPLSRQQRRRLARKGW